MTTGSRPRPRAVEADVALPLVAQGPSIRPVSMRARVGPWRDVLRRRMLAAADMLAVGATIGLFSAADKLTGTEAVYGVILLPLWALVAKLLGLYDRDHRALRHLTTDEVPNILTWSIAGSAVFGIGCTVASSAPSMQTLVEFALCVGLAAAVARAFARWLWRGLTPPENVVAVGSGPSAAALTRKLELFPDMHAQVVWALDEEALQDRVVMWQSDAVQVPRDGTRDRPVDVGRIVVAARDADERLIAELVAICRRDAIKLSVVPQARSLYGTAVRLNHVADLPLVEYNTWDISRTTRAIKRVIDVGLSLLLLVLLAPLLLLATLLVRLTSPGRAFFVQTRAGRDGRPFRMYKFRTMVRDAEQRLSELVDVDQLPDPVFKLADDPRVTPIGRPLRRWSFDELPQLLNVLRGDMSLVGPRPEQIDLVERYGEDAARVRLAVKPGLTGPMQVFGRAQLGFDERLAIEREYVENLSLLTDLRIMLATVAVVARGNGAI